MNFHEAERYLLSLGNEVSAMKLGLENIRRLLAELGEPQTKYLKIQVAGTNGKGSVCVFLNSIVVHAGIRAGMYTSPHLVSITERIKINDDDISEDDFARYATVIRDVSEKLAAGGEMESVPTFFEQVTAIALVAFAEASVELAILETGLGGKLDATTAANAEIAAITRVDFDHQKYLGDTIEEIATEKAAIIHQGSRVVIGEQKSEAMGAILARCRGVGVTPIFAAPGRNTSGSECVPASVPLSLPVGFPPLGLAGRHQIENAQVALAAARILGEYFSITPEHIVAGLGSARHPGRLEQVGRFLLDGAHNVSGAAALGEYLDEFVPQEITMIFGAVNDKNVGAIASILFPRADRLILTRLDNSRSLSLDDLAEVIPEAQKPRPTFRTSNVGEAIAKAREISSDNDLILVTGSLYLVGEARAILFRSNG